MDRFIIIFLFVITMAFIIGSATYLYVTGYNPNEVSIEIYQEGEHDQ